MSCKVTAPGGATLARAPFFVKSYYMPKPPPGQAGRLRENLRLANVCLSAVAAEDIRMPFGGAAVTLDLSDSEWKLMNRLWKRRT